MRSTSRHRCQAKGTPGPSCRPRWPLPGPALPSLSPCNFSPEAAAFPPSATSRLTFLHNLQSSASASRVALEHPADLSPSSPRCSSLGCSAPSLGSALLHFAPPPSPKYPILADAAGAQPRSAAPLCPIRPYGPAPSPPYRSSPSRMVPEPPTRFHGSSTGSSVSMAMRFFPPHPRCWAVPGASHGSSPLIRDPQVPQQFCPASKPVQPVHSLHGQPLATGCGTQACCEHGGLSPNSLGDNTNFSPFCHPLTPIPGDFLLPAAGAVAADACQVLGSPSN